VVEPARPGDADAIAALFTASRRAAMPWLPERHDEAGVRDHFATRVLPSREVLVIRRAGAVAAFLALDGNEVEHLYVHPDAQRAGLGSALLDAAKARRPGGLELWAFRRNTPALAFYARHGFAERFRTDGADNEEREPDVRLGWPA
jgi:GNAT superfamily N-acetyltransferase